MNETRVWRSMVSNMVLFIICLSIALVLAITAASYSSALGITAWAAVAAILVAAAVRALMMGVIADERGVKIRNFETTKFVPWDEIQEIGYGRMQSGPAGLAGAKVPHVVRSHAGKVEYFELRPLGSYRTASDVPDAVRELRRMLARSRKAAK